MASAPTDRIPLYTIILPVLGIAAWLTVGKVGVGLLAIVIATVLIGNVVSAVHHAEVVALRVGEPFGTLVLALAVTVIEVGLIISMMLGGEPNPALLRDTVHAVVMLVLHGLAGLCIVVGAFRQRGESEFRVEGANAFLAVLMPMAILVLVLPNHLIPDSPDGLAFRQPRAPVSSGGPRPYARSGGRFLTDATGESGNPRFGQRFRGLRARRPDPNG